VASAAPRGRAPGENEYAIFAEGKTRLTPDQARLFWDLRRQAARSLREQRWEAAAAALDRMIAMDPRHEDALYERGNCDLELGRYVQAKARWEELVRVNPAATRAWTQLGGLHALPDAGALFDPAEACRLPADVHRLNPEESGALILWGEAAVALGDLSGAERVLAQAYRLNARATSALLLGAYVAWKRGDDRTARDLLARAASSAAVEPQPAAVPGEGDTRAALDAIRRRASERRLFASCVDSLRAAGPSPDPRAIFALVDAERTRLPRLPAARKRE
jgi:tetratricopeptide (TPR) repeat protein